MPLQFTYAHRTGFYPHERGKHVCLLLYPTATGASCPIADPHFTRGGCTTTLATSIGARLRCELDRTSAAYKQLFDQRTATERINSQAKELGIERPKLRNQRSITNQNTLIYVLLNLRLVQRMQAHASDLPHREDGLPDQPVALTA